MKYPLLAAVAAGLLLVHGASFAAKAVKADFPPPSARELATICEQCAIVGSVKHVEKKGKASAVGTLGGAVVGGVVGNKVGDGGTLATGAGAVAGAMVGREIEKRAKKEKVWVTRYTAKDGKVYKAETESQPDFKAGEVVRVSDGKLQKR